jgi:hypothetical protein
VSTTGESAPDYQTLTGKKLDDLEDIKSWDDAKVLEAIENTKDIA